MNQPSPPPERHAPAAPAPSPALVGLSDLLADWQQEAIAAHEAFTSKQKRGPVSGFDRVDLELGGCFPPGVHIIHAQPGAGKSAFALQSAGQCGCPALFVSCEMSARELFRRTTARVTSTFLGRLKSGELRPDESLALARRAAADCKQLTLADASLSPASPSWLRRVAEGVRGEAKHLLVVVDSLHSWVEGLAWDVSEYEALNSGLAALRALSSQLECPVLCIAERNRVGMKGGLSAGAGTRKLEYSGESVLELQRDADIAPDAFGEVPVTLKFCKNRNGAAGKKIDLKFHGALQRFREV